ncbi:hypothetical protein A5630_09070 [Mycolicibacterium mucogenicum]|uniref:Tetracyclin repressor-like C-terminal domain-containing protein n=2 Tax=Mycolicibacterium mucogenicum TaxID=56689 RepID=A0A1A3GK24_MYCMU|nr:hypothetical protein A5630_09070 [Mycolicibacterium mucogenicum]
MNSAVNYHESLRNAARQLRHAATQSTSPTERIHSYIAAMIDHVYPAERCAKASVLASIWLNRAGPHVDQNDALVDELIEPLRAAIRVGCRTGEMSSPCPDTDAQAIFDLVTGMILTHGVLGRRASAEHIKGVVMDAVGHSLKLNRP